MHGVATPGPLRALSGGERTRVALAAPQITARARRLAAGARRLTAGARRVTQGARRVASRARQTHHEVELELDRQAVGELDGAREGVDVVSASAYLDLTLPVVRYRVAGLAARPDGRIVSPRRIVAKVSREEVARRFLAPPPERLLRALVVAGVLVATLEKVAGSGTGDSAAGMRVPPPPSARLPLRCRGRGTARRGARSVAPATVSSSR